MTFLRASVCVFALCFGCSSDPPATTPPMDSGYDAPPDIPPIPDAFLGAGSINVQWTVNGMPPAQGCAAAGATTVHLTQRVFNIDERLPCTDGRFAIENVASTNLSLTGELLNASDTVVYAFTAVDTVRSGETLDMNFPFGPPGSLVVNWTINGMPPTAANCDMVMGYGVQITVGLGSPIQASFGRPTGILCSARRYRFPMLQSSTFTVDGSLFAMMGASLSNVTTTAIVRSGEESMVTFDFTR